MQELNGNKVGQIYSLKKIETLLKEESFPIAGYTEQGSARFAFLKPSFYAGIAVHAGSCIREDIKDAMMVSSEDRYREEDPGTERFLDNFPLSIAALDSRFEYDLNRSEERTIIKSDEKAWGLKIWKRTLKDEERERTLEKYREFHQLMDILSDYLVSRGKEAYIFDIHSYCYQRKRSLPWHIDGKPDINLGTISINKNVFGNSIDILLKELNKITIDNRKIRVAENEIFKGGHIARRLCERHYEHLAVFALEFKKIFINEWSGEFYNDLFDELKDGFSRSLKNFLLAVSG